MNETIKFPKSFLWGAATSAHQVEGDNIHSDWWAYEQVPGNIQRNEKSGYACDHYNRFTDDFDLCRSMGHNAHRFSLEWARIEPREGQINEEAIAHYGAVLHALESRGIAPFVTVHHFTTPQWFAERGGFTIEENLRYFEHYCDLIACRFGARVPFWCTINEPSIFAMMGFLFGYFAPGKKNVIEFRRVMNNILAAHAICYRILKREAPGSRVGLVQNMPYYTPYNPANPLDRLAAAQHDWLYNSFILEGIRSGRRLPPLGDGRVFPGLKGSTDFWGLNYYNQSRCKWNWPIRTENAGADHRMTQTAWAPYPPGLKANLLRLSKFGLPIYITENGLATDEDEWRCAYLIEHLHQVGDAISEGADIRGYFYWSLLDNFEWEDGWFPKFGLVAVDPETFARKPKPSSRLYAKIARANAVKADWRKKWPWDETTMDMVRS